MKDENKTKRQLIDELAELRQRVAGLEGLQEEHRRAEEAAKVHFAELNQIFDTAADGMRVIDKDFTVLRINETFSNLAGISRDEAAGAKCYETFPGSLCHTPSCPLTRILGGEERVECDAEKERKDGVRIPCIVTATRFRGPGGQLKGIVEHFKDITERKLTEEKLSEHRNHLEELVVERTAVLETINEQLQQEVAERKETEMALRDSRDYLDRIISGMYEGLMVISRDHRILDVNERFVREQGATREEIIGRTCHEVTHGNSEPCDDAGYLCPLKSVLETCAPVSLEHVHKDYQGNDWVVELHAFPLVGATGEVESVVEISHDITEQKKAEEEIRQRSEQLAAVNAIAQTVSRSLDLERILSEALVKTLGLMGVESGVAYLFREETEDFWPVVHRRVPEDLLRQESGFKMGQGFSGRAAQSGEVLVVPDIQRDDTGMSLWYRRQGFRALVSVPLKSKNRVLGVMSLTTSGDREFSRQDVALLGGIGDRIGVAMENASLYRDVMRRVFEMEALHKTTLDITRHLGIAELLQSIVRTSQDVIPAADKAVIHLLDEESQLLVPSVPFDPEPDPLTRASMHVGEGIAGLVSQEKRTIYVPDIREDPGYLDLGSDVLSLLVAPLLIEEKLVGTLTVDSTQRKAFNPYNEKMLTMLASQAAVAIENAQLYERSRKSEERYRAYVENVPDAIWEMDAKNRFNYWSPQIENLTGYAPQELLGQTPYERLIHPDDVKEFRDRIRQTAQEGRQEYALAHRALHRDGSILQLETSIRVLRHDAGSIVRFQGVLRDVSERVRLQTQLLHSEKMAALGRLGASVAHEINNPLQSVQNCLTLLGEELQDRQRPDKLNQYLGVVGSEIERISAIVSRMRSFYRPEHRGVQPTSLHAVLASVLGLAGKQLQHSDVAIERELAEELPIIEANPDHLKQVFLNLVLNAIDAMPEGGTLRISTAQDRVEAARDERLLPAVRVEFSDTGEGMPPEILSRIFEPFFTSREEGTGLGLSISYGIIESHNGRISATSQVGVGTTFTILLPVEQP